MRFSAHDWSRTSTSFRTLPPQGSVSTNSTTWALKVYLKTRKPHDSKNVRANIGKKWLVAQANQCI